MRVQFGPGALLQQFAKPTPLFEHEHDFDAPCEGGCCMDAFLGLKPQAESCVPSGQRRLQRLPTKSEPDHMKPSSASTMYRRYAGTLNRRLLLGQTMERA